MAQNITLLGATYPDVPAVDLPKTGGGTARFIDITESGTPVYDGTTTSDTKYDALFLETVGSGVDTVKVGLDMDLLWTNSAPTSSFSAQTLSIDMSDYNMIFVIATSRTDLDVRFTALFNVGTYTARLCTTFTGTNVYTTRNVNLTSASLGFEGGYNGSTANNSYCIPLYIYGVR